MQGGMPQGVPGMSDTVADPAEDGTAA